MPIVGQFGSLAGFGMFPGGALESIATVTVGSGGASSITFSDIPSGFQHLQVRWVATAVGYDKNIAIRLNGDTAGNYTLHELVGNGSAASAGALTAVGFARVGYWIDTAMGSSTAYVGIIDILDYASTSKTTTIRCLNGGDNNGTGRVGINSSMWTSTNAVTSLTLLNSGANLAQYTTAALYGVRA
jgi:hypothetical protein